MNNYLSKYIFTLITTLQISSTYASTINTLCGGGTNTGNCETAYGAVDVSCRDMLNSNSLVCTSSCGTALSAAATACISSVSLISANAILSFDILFIITIIRLTN